MRSFGFPMRWAAFFMLAGLLSCSNGGGNSGAGPTTAIQPPAISSFTATPSGITTGQNTTLAWVVNGATGLSLDQGLGSVTGTSNRNVTPTTTTTYILTATNAAGSVTAPATVTVTAAPQPPAIASFTATPAAITAGQSSMLAWVVSGATSLSLDQSLGSVTGSSSRSVTPAATTTYILTATNAVGSVTAMATVTVTPAPQPPAIVSFAATPAAITAGQSSVLAWVVSGATSLSLDQGLGSVTGSSSRSVTPAATTTYILTATNAVGSVTAAATVTVTPAPQPPAIPSFTATPTTITAGQSSVLAWVANGATSLSLDQGLGSVTGTSSRSVTPAATTTYILSATNAVGSVTATATVTVTPAPQPPAIASFTATPAAITAGQSSLLAWVVTGATSLSIDQGIGSVTGTSSSVTPAATTTYILTATNAVGSVTAAATVTVTAAPPTLLSAPILFVTQVPFDGFGTISMPFANHDGSHHSAPRGGDLWIRYVDGSCRNLTLEAGYGMTGLQGANAIAVREPSVHWSGTKAVFAMALGSTTQQYLWETRYWQLYEVAGLGQGQPVSITKVPNQPTDANNISPVYGRDDRIIFASDRSRSGEAHLYPQLDEYESTMTLSGIWSLNPATGNLKILEHAPSGAFHPFVDSFGRVIFTKWDHLQRDQQADADVEEGGTNGSFNYADEGAAAARLESRAEVFPEPRATAHPENVANRANGHTFNQFFPWQMNEDGSEEETLNHVGRHEIGGYYLGEPSFNDDPNLSEYAPEANHLNRNYLFGDGGVFYLREDPLHPGLFYAANMREFNGGRAGQIVTISGAPTTNPESMLVNWITDPATRNEVQDGDPVPAGATGRYRNPLPLSDGKLVAAHTAEVNADTNLGTRANPNYRYQFRLKTLVQSGPHFIANQLLTPGFSKSVSWYDPDVLVSYSGPLWELDPVEVVARPRPPQRTTPLETPESQVLAEESVNETQLRAWLSANDLALIISRDVTSRDRGDVQQPFNVRVPGGASTIATSGKVYDLQHLQIFQGDLIRGYGGTASPREGRRVLAKTMHGTAAAKNPANPGGPVGSVKVALDGSTAAFVPARRALTWQITDPTGKAVIRERNWISFQPGEIRTCASCHGLNTRSQAGGTVPQNKPEALRQLLRLWKTLP